MAERHLWEHEPRGYGWSCHSQIYGTGCTQPATWRHGTAPKQYLATYWCERHKPMAEGAKGGPARQRLSAAGQEDDGGHLQRIVNRWRGPAEADAAD